MYVLKRIDQGGGYVAQPGSKSSYTRSLITARLFHTMEEAEKDRCVENEVVLNYEHLIYRRGAR